MLVTAPQERSRKPMTCTDRAKMVRCIKISKGPSCLSGGNFLPIQRITQAKQGPTAWAFHLIRFGRPIPATGSIPNIICFSVKPAALRRRVGCGSELAS